MPDIADGADELVRGLSGKISHQMPYPAYLKNPPQPVELPQVEVTGVVQGQMNPPIQPDIARLMASMESITAEPEPEPEPIEETELSTTDDSDGDEEPAHRSRRR